MNGTPSKRYLESKGQVASKGVPNATRHPTPVPHILIPRCQAQVASGEQCKNPSTRWEFCFQHRGAAQ